MGQLELARGRYPESLEALGAAVRTQPDAFRPAFDLALAHLDNRKRDATGQRAPTDLVTTFTDNALASARGIDRTFWLLATADAIADEPPPTHRHLLRLAARRIHATYAVPHDQRLAATRLLFAKVVTID